MKFLVLSAMTEETEAMETALKGVGFVERRIPGVFYRDQIEVHLHRVGVGKVNAAIGASLGVISVKPDYVISQGCCAGYTGLEVGEAFFVNTAYEYDFTLEPIGYKKAEIPVFDKKIYGFKSEGENSTSLPEGVMMTADRFCIGGGAFYGIPCGKVVGADMETAAIAHVCHVTGDRFVGIRAVSDIIGAETQAEDFDNNVFKACESAAKATVAWIIVNS